MHRWSGAVVLILHLLAAVSALAAGNDRPLALPDTSSPRATLKSFLDNVEEAYRPYYLDNEMAHPDVDAPARRRAALTLDLSQLPPAQVRRRAKEAILLLNEVLGRVTLPPYQNIPDAEAMSTLPAGRPKRWRVPETPIEIVQVEEGPRQGEYLFSPETVDRAYEFYSIAKALPYKAGAMGGLFERVVYEPGPLLMQRGWISQLPPFMNKRIGQQLVWQWAGLALSVGAWLLLVVVALRITRARDGKARYWARVFLALILMVATFGVRYVVRDELHIVGDIFAIIDSILVAITYVLSAYILVNVGAAIGESIVVYSRTKPKSIDANLIRVITRSLAWIGVLVLIVMGAARLGVPVSAVITSLGIGGLAFALAARPTLENLVAGITLFVDKPVRVGDLCNFGDVTGTVEEIGLRSTRIRLWSGSLLTVPNAQFAEIQLHNWDDTKNLWIRTTVGLRHETTTDQLRFVLTKLREMLFSHPRIIDRPQPRVRLIGFGEYSLDVQIQAWTDTGSWAERRGIREDIYLRVKDIIEESGTRLAIPSHTQYVTRDIGLDADLKMVAERQVQSLRDEGELPFPDMARPQREKLRGTLDYPPVGSVARRPGDKPGDKEDKSGQ